MIQSFRLYFEKEARKQIAEELIADIPFISFENNRLLQLHRRRLVSTDPVTLLSDMLNFPSHANLRGSPYRHANFDLVKNYTLYLGIAKVLKEMFASKKSVEDSDWLAEFFMTHGRELIRPYGGMRGRADEVIEKLLETTPAVRGNEFFDPAALTERILEMREKCAAVWLTVMKEAEKDQLDLKRKLLEDEV